EPLERGARADPRAERRRAVRAARGLTDMAGAALVCGRRAVLDSGPDARRPPSRRPHALPRALVLDLRRRRRRRLPAPAAGAAHLVAAGEQRHLLLPLRGRGRCAGRHDPGHALLGRGAHVDTVPAGAARACPKADTAERGLAYVDLHDLLRPDEFLDSLHLTAEGNRRVAAALAPAVLNVLRSRMRATLVSALRYRQAAVPRHATLWPTSAARVGAIPQSVRSRRMRSLIPSIAQAVGVTWDARCSHEGSMNNGHQHPPTAHTSM